MSLFQQQPAANPDRRSEFQAWVRRVLNLEDDAVVMISELRCSEPGCPPLETVIAVLGGPRQGRPGAFPKADRADRSSQPRIGCLENLTDGRIRVQSFAGSAGADRAI